MARFVVVLFLLWACGGVVVAVHGYEVRVWSYTGSTICDPSFSPDTTVVEQDTCNGIIKVTCDSHAHNSPWTITFNCAGAVNEQVTNNGSNQDACIAYSPNEFTDIGYRVECGYNLPADSFPILATVYSEAGCGGQPYGHYVTENGDCSVMGLKADIPFANEFVTQRIRCASHSTGSSYTIQQAGFNVKSCDPVFDPIIMLTGGGCYGLQSPAGWYIRVDCGYNPPPRPAAAYDCDAQTLGLVQISNRCVPDEFDPTAGAVRIDCYGVTNASEWRISSYDSSMLSCSGGSPAASSEGRNSSECIHSQVTNSVSLNCGYEPLPTPVVLQEFSAQGCTGSALNTVTQGNGVCRVAGSNSVYAYCGSTTLSKPWLVTRHNQTTTCDAFGRWNTYEGSNSSACVPYSGGSYLKVYCNGVVPGDSISSTGADATGIPHSSSSTSDRGAAVATAAPYPLVAAATALMSVFGVLRATSAFVW